MKIDAETTVVSSSTDLRLVFCYELPEGAIFNSSASYFEWNKGEETESRQVTASKIFTDTDGKTKCSLVITGVPRSAFDTTIRATLHIVYVLDGESYTLTSTSGSRSVYGVCNALKQDLPSDNTWYKYAAFLLDPSIGYTIG